jgi:hypothetical protein
MADATGRLPYVMYRVDTPFATSGWFSSSLSSDLSWANFESRVLLERSAPLLIYFDQ